MFSFNILCLTVTKQFFSFLQSNSSLHQFGDLKLYASEWIQSSSYVMQSANILAKTLPILQVYYNKSSENQINSLIFFIPLHCMNLSNNSSQNSLRNPFVQNFIQTQTGIDVGQMSSTLDQFCKFSWVWYHGDASLLLQKVSHYSQFYEKQSHYYEKVLI